MLETALSETRPLFLLNLFFVEFIFEDCSQIKLLARHLSVAFLSSHLVLVRMCA